MNEKQNKINRRNFFKTMAAAGLGSVFASAEAIAAQKKPDTPAKVRKTTYPQVPKRKLGKTGVEVPCLALGAMYNLIENQVMLIKSLQWGVSYWDTAHNYAGGNSELGIGKYLLKNPEVRKDVFIVSKASGARTVKDVENRLQTSLKRMNTEYIDLYFGVHALSGPARLTDELRQWAEDAKKRKQIRFFGFSTHSNMAQCLAAAAKLDWIDAIMTSYNFRLMQDAKMDAAVEACHKANIGLIAMKTQAVGQKFVTEEDKKLAGHLLQSGFIQEQAKIKAVLEDKRISSACVGMETVAVLNSNVVAVLDKTELSRAEMDALSEYAASTCSGYCAGCAHICDSALPNMPYVSDIMRYLMYYNSHGRQDLARELFAQIPQKARNRLLNTDYSDAEARCPQHMPIAELIAEAVGKLA